MLTPKVTEITRLSAHRSDAAPTQRCNAPAGYGESRHASNRRTAGLALGVRR
jgi:hypothetical protein